MKIITKMRNLPLLLIVTLAVMMSSCKTESGSDSVSSPDEVNNTIHQTLMKNKWVYRSDPSYGEGSDYHVWVENQTTYLYFTSQSAGFIYWITRDQDNYLGTTTTKEYKLFKYTISNNTINLEEEDDEKSIYIFENNCLRRESGSAIFTPSALTESDRTLMSEIGPKEGNCGQNLSYSYDDRTQILTISGKGKMYDYTSSNQPWHDYNFKSVCFEEGCTYVGTHAFDGVSAWITEIDWPTTLTEIGDYAFPLVKIEKWLVPKNLIKIGAFAFYNCSNLKSVNFSGCDALEEIGNHAFEGCPIKFSYFHLPKNVKKVGDAAFMCSTFSNDFFLNETVETIGDAAFYAAELHVTKLEIPNSVKSIGKTAFRGNIGEIHIGTGLRSLGSTPFLANNKGSIYVNLGNPLPLDFDGIIGNTDVDATRSWTLYVPVGSKNAYQTARGWRNFNSIIESSSLVSGNGTPSDSGDNSDDNSGDNTDGGGNNNPTQTGVITYQINGVSFKTVLVEGENMAPFYIMETEIPPQADFKIGTTVIEGPDRNKDGIIIKTEFSTFLKLVREASGLPFRLPTKEEWLFAAKGGNKSKSYIYSGSNSINNVAWYKDNSGNSAHQVAVKTANELGLYDMSGNYGEICQHEGKDEADVDGPICGGAWNDVAADCKVTSWKEGVVNGKIGLLGTISEKGAIDGRITTVRLVYTK